MHSFAPRRSSRSLSLQIDLSAALANTFNATPDPEAVLEPEWWISSSFVIELDLFVEIRCSVLRCYLVLPPVRYISAGEHTNGHLLEAMKQCFPIPLSSKDLVVSEFPKPVPMEAQELLIPIGRPRVDPPMERLTSRV